MASVPTSKLHIFLFVFHDLDEWTNLTNGKLYNLDGLWKQQLSTTQRPATNFHDDESTLLTNCETTTNQGNNKTAQSPKLLIRLGGPNVYKNRNSSQNPNLFTFNIPLPNYPVRSSLGCVQRIRRIRNSYQQECWQLNGGRAKSNPGRVYYLRMNIQTYNLTIYKLEGSEFSRFLSDSIELRSTFSSIKNSQYVRSREGRSKLWENRPSIFQIEELDVSIFQIEGLTFKTCPSNCRIEKFDL